MPTVDWLLLVALTASAPAAPPALGSVSAGALVGQAGEWRGAPPPPPPPMERVRPRRGFVWVEGGYDWRGRRYVRLPGHWERVREGRHWHGGHWEWQGDHYAWTRGLWSDAPAYAPPPEMMVDTPPALPPPPQQAAPPPPPRPGFVWIAGAHEWRDGRYVWVDGHWEQERSGDSWQAGHWDRDGDRQGWHPGGWEHGDHDHGDHDHGDHDHGDHGDHDHGSRGGIAIEGQVIDQSGRPAAGITVVLAGTSEGRAVTDGNGHYVFTGLAPGSYAVRPNDPRCGFRPDVMNLNNLGSNTIQNFSANCR
jgi:hypothetical protein